MSGGGYSGSEFEVRREVHSRRTAAFEACRLLLRGLVGLKVVYVGQADGKPRCGCLYPERIGSACRIVEANLYATHCPLVVEFRDGQRGIAEPDWLMEPQ